MKYTYQISFNGSDYLDLTPGNPVEFDGSWITDTKIWRENISDLKITKRQNSDIYDTLETYFEDATYFTTRIFVKVLKSDVQESLHWFGIKWGTLNKELKTYEVQPLAYDLWGQYFESVSDLMKRPSPTSTTYYLYDDNTNHTYLQRINLGTGRYPGYLWENFTDLIVEISDWLESDVVSSFMQNDNYEDGSSISTTFGMPRDYVTNTRSLIRYAGLIKNETTKYSLKDMLRLFLLFRAYCFFDSNNKFRIEHIKFFNDKLIDNAVDYSSHLNSYDEKWSYLNSEIQSLENISLSIPTGATDEDFSQLSIVYNDVRNRPDLTFVDHQFSWITDLNAYGSTAITGVDTVLMGGIQNMVYELTNVDFLVYTSDFNYFSFSWNAIGQQCRSHDLRVENATSYALSVTLSNFISASGAFYVYFKSRGSGLDISNKVSVGALGVTTGTLTTTSQEDDAIIVFESYSGATGQAQGHINIERSSFPTNHITIPSLKNMSGDYKSNGAMSLDNIIDRWWQDDRISRAGSINGSDYTFDNTQYNLRRETVKFFYDGVINPLYGFNDGTRIGLIEKWTRSPETGFYEIDLIYQEDE